jgi:cytochrome c peroxidase
MLVTCEGDRTLRRFSVATRTQTGMVTLGPSPRAIAINQAGTRALVTRFLSGEHVGQVYDVSLAGGMTLTRTIDLTRDRAVDGGASSRGVPNYLGGIRISPDGQWAWVVGKKDNTTRGTFFGQTMVPGQDTTVRAQLMLINLTTNAEDVTRRLDIDNSDSPSAIAFSPLGDYAFLALQGNAMVAVIDVLDFMRQDSPGTVRSRWSVGLAPQGIVMDAANNRVLTGDFMGRSVTALDVASFLTTGNTNVSSTAVEIVGDEKLHDAVLQGKRLFYHASDPRMSAEGYISCATCHIDGGHDGRTFDFTNRGEGFRNTTDLRGRSGTAHGNVHWSGNFDEIQDFEIDIRQFFGGSGFLDNSDWASVAPPLGAPKANRNADLDALAAYVSSLGASSLPRSPHRTAAGGLSDAALRGQAVFMAHNCASCHNPATDYTDGLMHNVGTLKASSGNRLGGALTAIRTPTLLGLHAGAPYLHDGSAATLEEVFTVTGGRLAQMEHGTMGSGAFAEDINWIAMKEWHNSQFVNIQGSRTVTFSNVASSSAGPGYIDVRYNSAYGNSVLNVRVNGVLTQATMTMVPNEPSWWPNEWRRVRVPVQFSAGMNTVQFSRGGSAGPQLLVDDVLFSTPQDAALAAAHVRSFAPGERDDLMAYLLSLDGSNAVAPLAIVAREGILAQDAVDVVNVPDGAAEFNVVYTIQNTGGGILNLGRFHLISQPEGAAIVERQPAAQIAPGESTELEIRFLAAGDPSTTSVRGWSDGGGELRWSVQTNVGVVPVASTWSIY